MLVTLFGMVTEVSASQRIECIHTNGCHTAGNGDRDQSSAVGEHAVAYTRHTAGNGYMGQIRTTCKCTYSYVRHTVGDSDGSQVATTERILPDARHAVLLTVV